MQSRQLNQKNKSALNTSKNPKNHCLKIIPLGGLHEIGKNTCLFEYGDDIILIDAGLAFPCDGMHGVNVVMPDTTYLQANLNRFRGMIVTHGHEDHIGGISHHLKKFNIPIIYGPPLAMSMLKGKIEEAGVYSSEYALLSQRLNLQELYYFRC